MTRLRPPVLLDTIRSIQSDLDELKATQNVGQSELIGYQSHSTNLNDFSFTILSSAVKNYILTFTHDKALHGSIQQLFFFYSIDQPDVLNFYIPPWSNGPAVAAYPFKLTPTDAANQWYINVSNNDPTLVTYTVYFKYFFAGTDSGSWSIAPA